MLLSQADNMVADISQRSLQICGFPITASIVFNGRCRYPGEYVPRISTFHSPNIHLLPFTNCGRTLQGDFLAGRHHKVSDRRFVVLIRNWNGIDRCFPYFVNVFIIVNDRTQRDEKSIRNQNLHARIPQIPNGISNFFLGLDTSRI